MLNWELIKIVSNNEKVKLNRNAIKVYLDLHESDLLVLAGLFPVDRVMAVEAFCLAWFSRTFPWAAAADAAEAVAAAGGSSF